MSKVAADPKDPTVQFSKAATALRRLERRQKAAFENFSTSWKQKRVAVIADIGDDAFRMLRAGNVVTANDEKNRAEALKLKSEQELTGLDVDQEHDKPEMVD